MIYPGLKTAEGDLIGDTEFLWRYIDLHQFFTIINSDSIPFTRLDLFRDPLEAAKIDELVQWYMYWRCFKDTKDEQFNPQVPQDAIDRAKLMRDRPLEQTPLSLNERQKRMYASCWYLNATESFAMWDLYSNPDSVAIKCKPISLLNSFRNNSSIRHDSITGGGILSGKVMYVDYRDPDFYTKTKDYVDHSLAFRKDTSYKHENEYRFIFVSSNPSTLMRVEISLDNFKDLDFQIVTHPRMAKWKLDNIETYCHNLNLKVRRSELMSRE